MEEKDNLIYCNFPLGQNFKSIIDVLKLFGPQFSLRFSQYGILIEENDRDGVMRCSFSFYAEDMVAYDYFVKGPDGELLPLYFITVKTDNFFNVVKGDKRAGVSLTFYLNISEELNCNQLVVVDVNNGGEKIIQCVSSGYYIQEYENYCKNIIEMGTNPNSKILASNLAQIIDGYTPKSGKKHGSNPIAFIKNEEGAIMVLSLCGGQFQGKHPLPTGTVYISDNDAELNDEIFASLREESLPENQFRIEVVKLTVLTKIIKISPGSVLNIYMVEGYPLIFFIKFTFGYCILYYSKI